MTTFKQIIAENPGRGAWTIYDAGQYLVRVEVDGMQTRLYGRRFNCEPGLYVYPAGDSVPIETRPADTLEAAVAECDKLQAAHDARAREAAAKAASSGPALATPRQVDYIMSLLARGRREEGGFYYGPTDRAGVESMTRAQASAYIDSLKGSY